MLATVCAFSIAKKITRLSIHMQANGKTSMSKNHDADLVNFQYSSKKAIKDLHKAFWKPI